MCEHTYVSYGPGVLVGCWVDKRSQNELIKQKFIADYNEGKSNLQRTRLMKRNLLAPVLLAKPDYTVRKGTMVQIVAPDVPCFRKNDPTGHYGMTLASTVCLSDVDDNPQLCPECPILCSPNLEAVTRNTWQILGADGKCETDGVPLKFGENITIASATPGQPLYVRSPKPALNNPNAYPFGTPLHLSPVLDRYCLFRLLRVKGVDEEGATVEPFTRVYITHFATNETLFVDDLNVTTFFGVEKAASVKLNRNRKQKDVKGNIWMIATRGNTIL